MMRKGRWRAPAPLVLLVLSATGNAAWGQSPAPAPTGSVATPSVAPFATLIEALPGWLRLGIFDVELWQLAGVLLLLLLAMALQKAVVLAIGNYLRRLAGRLNLGRIESVVQQASGPVGGLAAALMLSIGFPILHFSSKINQFAAVAIQVLAALSAVWLGLRLVDVLATLLAENAARTESKLDDQLVPLLRKSLKLFIAAVGGIFILQNLNVDVASLLAGLGLGGLAFALAAKDTVANFFGSIMIFIDKPFQIGDWIKMGTDVEGTVEEVGFRTTRVRTFYNSVITLPNARIADSAVDNLGVRRYRRYKGTLELTYDTPPETIQAFCEGVRAIIQALPGMRKDYYLVEFTDFGPHSLQVLLYCFMDTPTWDEELRTRSHLNLEIMRLAQRLGAQFAFPTQTLHVLTPADAAAAGDEHAAPPAPERLAEVIRAFGPGGALARPRGVDLQVSYDPGAAPAAAPSLRLCGGEPVGFGAASAPRDPSDPSCGVPSSTS